MSGYFCYGEKRVRTKGGWSDPIPIFQLETLFYVTPFIVALSHQ